MGNNANTSHRWFTPSCLLILLMGCVSHPLYANQSTRDGLANHDRAVHILGDVWMRDPYIYLHTDGWYYLTCTRLGNITGGEQGVEMWRSRDLSQWESLGVPWTFSDSSWLHTVKRKPTDKKPDFWLWAPEVHFIDGRWVTVHATNRGRANLLTSEGPSFSGPFREPFDADFGKRHDPSIFTDVDNRHWLVWACAKIAPLKDDFSGFSGPEIAIGPSNRKLGHEGCFIRKIGDKYVLFGTAWSMDGPRQGSCNLYYCTAQKITGPYGPRKFAGRFCGHGTPFQDKQGRWWTTAFLNGQYETDPDRGQAICADLKPWTLNPWGLTLVPLDVRILDDGEIDIRAKPEGYAAPGPEEKQSFHPTTLTPPAKSDSVGASPMEVDTDLATAQKRDLVRSHTQAFETLNERVRDPFIHRGPDDNYYLTGTTAGSHWGETIGIRLWRSSDLADWKDLGFVWDLYREGKPAESWHFRQPLKNPTVKNPRAIWAPEIHCLNGTWWVPHCLNVSGHGLLRSKSGQPSGPYEPSGMIHESGIDAHLFQDAGHTYYLWGSKHIARMTDDLSGLAETPREIGPPGKHPLGYEGVLLIRVGKKYVLFASGRYGYEPTDTYDLYYSVADHVMGPYGPRRMAVKNAGHGNVFQDADDRWWSAAFDHDFMGTKWAPWLVPIEITETEDDVLIEVNDARFRPTEEDQRVVRELAKSGIPEQWLGKSPWHRPD